MPFEASYINVVMIPLCYRIIIHAYDFANKKGELYVLDLYFKIYFLTMPIICFKILSWGILSIDTRFQKFILPFVSFKNETFSPPLYYSAWFLNDHAF